MLSLPKHPAVRRIAKNSVIASLRGNLVETKRQTIAPDKFLLVHGSTKVERLKL